MFVDIDALAGYLEELCGSAMTGGFPGAMADLVSINPARPDEVIELAERLDVDISQFEVGKR